MSKLWLPWAVVGGCPADIAMFLSTIYDNVWYLHVFATVPKGVLAHSLGTVGLRGGVIENMDLKLSSLAPEPMTC